MWTSFSVRSLHYVERVGEMMERVFRWLRPRGSFVFSVEHLLRHANRAGEWTRDASGRPQAWPVDAYLDMEPSRLERNGVTQTRWPRTVSYYVQEPLRCGFMIREVHEPNMTEEGRLLNPAGAEKIQRVPPVLIVRADKPGGGLS